MVAGRLARAEQGAEPPCLSLSLSLDTPLHTGIWVLCYNASGRSTIMSS